MIMDDIIAAISTPPGKGGIGIIRLSGPGSVSLAEKFIAPKKGKPLSELTTRTLHLSVVRNSLTGAVIDEAFAVHMNEHSSYTGEEMVEIQCHGSPFVLREILSSVIKSGARIAEPGEFTKRAFLNGKMDLTEAEAVQSLINAGTRKSGECALRQLSGGLHEKIEGIRLKIVDILSELEASIDFPEEEIELPRLKEKISALDVINKEIAGLIKGALAGRILREGYLCVIAGRANVGKSSLFNRILDYERAIVTEIPGTTRDFIVEGIELNGYPVKLADTAGIMEGKDKAEEESIRRSFDILKNADLVLFVIDASEGISIEDREIYSEIVKESEEVRMITVLNKTDLEKKVNFDGAVKEFKSLGTVGVSAKDGTGIDKLTEEIARAIEDELSGIDMEITVNMRHRDCLQRVSEAVGSAINLIEGGGSEEFAADDLKASLRALEEITGKTFTDEVLDRIFESFCIGK